MSDVRAEVGALRPRYGKLFDEIESDLAEFVDAGSMSRAKEVATATGQHLNHNQYPNYFGGDLDAEVVLVHLNPKHEDDPSPQYTGQFLIKTLEDYFESSAYFGAHNYGPSSPRTHRSPFDHKQVRFLRALGAMEFVEEHTREDRFTNLERAIDRKLQLELVPYGSANFRTHAYQRDALAPHRERILEVVAATPRRYVLFCGAVFESLLGEFVTRRHVFHLVKKDGSTCQARSSFSNLEIPFGGGLITAGLCQSWPQQGIPMGAYGQEVAQRYANSF